jgi:hypothetical protein
LSRRHKVESRKCPAPSPARPAAFRAFPRHQAGQRRLPQYFERLIRISELVERATDLTVTLDHPVYDCFYVALAERERLPLVSADSRLLALPGRHRLIEARPL